MNEKALFKLSYGLYIISSAADGKQNGCVANTLQQVTATPAKLSVTLNKDNLTTELIEKSGLFNGVVLAQNADMDLIRRFGFQSGKEVNKYDGIHAEIDELGLPYVTEQVTARVSCKVVGKMDLGTHILFVGEVIGAEILNDSESMTYAYYHQVKNGSTPKNAPSYQEPKGTVGWKCSICGYVYEGDPLPEDYVCPLCGAPAAVFEKISN